MKNDPKQPVPTSNKSQPKAASSRVVKSQQDDLKIEVLGKDDRVERTIILERKGVGLTLGQWQELAKKDKSLLTPHELEQLKQANAMALQLTNRIFERYDFSKLFKLIESPGMTRALESAQRLAEVTERLRTSQLMQLQQSLAITSGIVNKSLLEAVRVSAIADSFFADFQTFHTRLVKALSIDIASLGVGLTRLTDTETIDFTANEVREQDGFIVTSGSTSQTQTVDEFVYVRKASLDFLFTELKATKAEVAEVRRLIAAGTQSGTAKIEYADARFKREASRLIIKGFEIVIGRSSKQAMFCEVFFRSPSDFVKKWDIEDLIQEAFGERFSDARPESYWLNSLRGYVFQLNRNILGATSGQFSDFFVLLGTNVYINPKYFSNL